MKTIEQIDLKDKKVVIRLDYNVPIEDGVIKDASKIEKTILTLKYLLNNNCKIIILSHFGRIKTEEDKENNSLKPVAQKLADLLQTKVKFIDSCYGAKVKKIVDESQNGEVIVLENTRFMDVPEKRESGNDLELAKFWASLGDLYINDAFASLHREHASTAGICKFLPHAIGFLVMNELKNLDILINDTPHPFTVFMGGAKVDDKLKIITNILPRCDYLLLGGGIANSFIKSQGANIGESLATNDPKILKEIKGLMNKYAKKIVLPIDFTIDNGSIFDLGIKTINEYKKYIDQSELIFVNGTCGKFEDSRFTEGTESLFKALKESGKDVIIGGGDTLSAVKKFGYEKSFKFLSSGGGATLEYIANKKLPALEWMEK